MVNMSGAPASERRMSVLATEARKLSEDAVNSVDVLVTERREAGAPLTNQEAFDLALELQRYRLNKETKREPEYREKLRALMHELRRAPEPESEEA